MYKVFVLTPVSELLQRNASFSHLEDAEMMFDLWADLLPAALVRIVNDETRTIVKEARP